MELLVTLMVLNVLALVLTTLPFAILTRPLRRSRPVIFRGLGDLMFTEDREGIMRRLIVAVGLLCAGVAQACDDHHGVCEIEDWRWYSVADYLTVEGVATCDAGRIRIRLYEGEGEKPKFLGTTEGRIKGHTFDVIGQNIQPPQSVSIKYSIEPQ